MKFFRLIRSLCRNSSISAIQGSAYADSASGSIFQAMPDKEALELVTESEGRVEVGPKVGSHFTEIVLIGYNNLYFF